jgi:RES domain-containing protein
MLVHRLGNCKYINDLSGYGAYLNGGRWNSTGVYMLYTSTVASLSLLEILAHLPAHLAHQNFCLLTIEIPDDLIYTVNANKLPIDWQKYPGPQSLKVLGDVFINDQKYYGLKVPSCIIPNEYNILLNPKHAAHSKTKILSVEKFKIDNRLIE